MPRKRVDDRELPQHTPPPRGVVAQLVEHHNGIVGVISSILFGSTKIWLQQFCWSLFLLSLNEGRREVAIAGDRSGDGVVAFLTLHLGTYLDVNVAAIAELEGRAGGGGGDKLSAVYGGGLLAHGNQVTVSANVHALMRDGRGGVAAFIKIIDGKDFEFSVSAHHDGFAV